MRSVLAAAVAVPICCTARRFFWTGSCAGTG